VGYKGTGYCPAGFIYLWIFFLICPGQCNQGNPAVLKRILWLMSGFQKLLQINDYPAREKCGKKFFEMMVLTSHY
jgi:hypothetical protein